MSAQKSELHEEISKLKIEMQEKEKALREAAEKSEREKAKQALLKSEDERERIQAVRDAELLSLAKLKADQDDLERKKKEDAKAGEMKKWIRERQEKEIKENGMRPIETSEILRALSESSSLTQRGLSQAAEAADMARRLTQSSSPSSGNASPSFAVASPTAAQSLERRVSFTSSLVTVSPSAAASLTPRNVLPLSSPTFSSSELSSTAPESLGRRTSLANSPSVVLPLRPALHISASSPSAKLSPATDLSSPTFELFSPTSKQSPASEQQALFESNRL